MIGGGFLGQMHETMKKNRDMVRESLGKSKRKAFENGNYPSSGQKNVLDDGKRLTDTERQELIAKIQRENKLEIQRRIILLFIAASIILALYFGLALIFR
jgi:hypothetical protein